MHVSHACHMHEPGTDARIWTCDVWWAAHIGAAHICNIIWCICLSNTKTWDKDIDGFGLQDRLTIPQHAEQEDHCADLSVITQSPPGPKGPLALYVHMQETVDHTLLRVAVCRTTVVSRLIVHVRRSVRKRKSNYKQGRIYLICWPNASKTGNHNTHHLP